MQTLITKLSGVGLSEYEAKAYIALIKDHPATAYEVSKSSGIPTSKIYEVLGRLLEKKFIHPANQEGNGKTRRYLPVSADEVLEQYRDSTQKLVESLKQDFGTLGQSPEPGYAWSILDDESLILKAQRMIQEARSVILLSIWPHEFEKLEAALREAEGRGVRIAVIHFGLPMQWVGQIFQHPFEDASGETPRKRGLVLVSDSQQVLMGHIRPEGGTEGTWSGNQSFAATAEDHIRHQIYLAKIVKRFEKDLIRKFGVRYRMLRDIFRDEEIPDEIF